MPEVSVLLTGSTSTSQASGLTTAGVIGQPGRCCIISLETVVSSGSPNAPSIGTAAGLSNVQQIDTVVTGTRRLTVWSALFTDYSSHTIQFTWTAQTQTRACWHVGIVRDDHDVTQGTNGILQTGVHATGSSATASCSLAAFSDSQNGTVICVASASNTTFTAEASGAWAILDQQGGTTTGTLRGGIATNNVNDTSPSVTVGNAAWCAIAFELACFPTTTLYNNESATTATRTFDSRTFTPAAGDVLYAFHWCYLSTVASPTVTIADNFGDTGGTSWTRRQVLQGGDNCCRSVWTRTVGTGASAGKVTVTRDVATCIMDHVLTVLDLGNTYAEAPVLSDQNDDTNVTTETLDVGSTPTANGNSLLVTAVHNNMTTVTNTFPTIPSGFTKDFIAVSDGNPCGVAHKSSAAQTSQWTTLTSDAGHTFASALVFVKNPINVSVGLNTETDSSLAMTKKKQKALGLNTETDTSLTLAKKLKQKALGLNTETDSSLTLAKKIKQKLIGLNTETDSSLTLAKRIHQRLLGLLTETDSSLTLAGKRKTKAAGLDTETDSALAMGRQKIKAIGIATETDSATTMAWAPKNRLVNTATETDTSLANTHYRQGHPGVTTETESALSITPRKVYAIGVATETDVAQSVTHLHDRTVGLATETETALAISKKKIVQVGIATETDDALSLSEQIAVAVNTTTETETALPITITKIRQLGIVSETDTAPPVGVTTISHNHPVGTAGSQAADLLTDPSVEVDASEWVEDLGTLVQSNAQARTGSNSLLLTADGSGFAQAHLGFQAADADFQYNLSFYALADTTPNNIFGYISFYDGAQALISSSPVELLLDDTSVWTFNQSVDNAPPGTEFYDVWIGFNGAPGEQHYFDDFLFQRWTLNNTALPITPKKIVQVGTATETDEATTLIAPQHRLLGVATETDDAQPITPGRGVTVHQTTETETAQPIDRRKQLRPNFVTETEQALPIRPAHARPLNTAVETDTAQSMKRVLLAIVGTATEAESALSINSKFLREIIIFGLETMAASDLGPLELSSPEAEVAEAISVS